MEGHEKIAAMCPPVLVSSPEEVGHYCHSGQARHFQIHNLTYECFAMNHHMPICKGKIHPRMELPKCSQETIADCGDETIYANFNDKSSGPCFYREEDVLWHSSKCSGNSFQCFDTTKNKWCAGTVESHVSPDPPVTCPPETVYSIHEATHYCSRSSLATRVDPEDPSAYACYWKNGTAACSGTIDPGAVQVPSCTIPIENCFEIEKVCRMDEGSRFLSCNDRQGELSFECWDTSLDQWCVGQIVRAKRTMKPYQTSTIDVNTASSQRWGVASIALMLVAGAMVGLVVERRFRDSGADPVQQHLPADKFEYHAVSDEALDHDLELTMMLH